MAFTIKGQLKAAAPIFWPFDMKGHKTNWERLPISYLHVKCEQNRSIDGREIAYLVFKAIRPFFKTLKRVHRRSMFKFSRSYKLCLSLDNHFLPSELLGAISIVVKMGQTWFLPITPSCPLVATSRSKQGLKISSVNAPTRWCTWIFPIFHP